jgi:hypothetical protein
MHPDTENDTRSPWYEAFAHHTPASPEPVPASGAVEDRPAPEVPEPDGSQQDLFDCYNA